MSQSAKFAAKCGLSVVPVGTDPQTDLYKRPTMAWKRLQSQIMCELEIVSVFKEDSGIALVGGKVSGNLECVDFDDPAAYPEWCDRVKACGLGQVLDSCYVQQTPSGGYHVVYRCKTSVGKNRKLCLPKDTEQEARIETRGEGGYFLVFPSLGYSKVQGKWSELPVIDEDERDGLLSIACAMSAEPERRNVTAPSSNYFVGMPGQDYDNRHTWADVLLPDGWKVESVVGDRTYWTRPGKEKGTSASSIEGGLLWVFTSSVSGLRPNESYSKFGFYAATKHGGDHGEAARGLREKGYGGGQRQQQRAQQPVQDAADRPKQRWIKASEVQEVKIDWLWNLYIPIGEVTMIVGNPGDGKSTVAQAIVTAVTLGADLFGDKVGQGSAVFLSAEQSVKSVTVPRFNRMGADLGRIILPDEVDEDDKPVPFVLDNSGMEELRAVCLEERPKIVVVDTVTAYIEASRDFNSPNQTREWMRRLAEIARTTPCAVVLLGHLNKNSSAHPLMRILGSIDFVGASRSVLLVGKDPDEEDVRGLAQIKSNVGPFGDPRGFRLEGDTFSWTDGSRLDANRMLQPAAIQAAITSKERCEAWMKGLFKGSNVVDAPARDDETGKIGGFTSYMVDATKKRLGVVSVKDAMADGGWAWKWGEDNVYRGGS